MPDVAELFHVKPERELREPHQRAHVCLVATGNARGSAIRRRGGETRGSQWRSAMVGELLSRETRT